jgi:gas vesicle protein
MGDRQAELLAQLDDLRQRAAKQDESGVNILGFLGGIALGLVAGAAIALFFPPQDGEEAREQLRDTGIELKERATQAAVQVRAQAES